MRSSYFREFARISKRILVAWGLVWAGNQFVLTLGDVGDPPLIRRANRQAWGHYIDSLGALAPLFMLILWVLKI